MKLRDIAHGRAGDKGNISNISVIAYRECDFQVLLERVTADKVQHHMSPLILGKVKRYILPNLFALNFVLYDALGGGVTISTSLDKHGKSLSSYLLDMEI